MGDTSESHRLDSYFTFTFCLLLYFQMLMVESYFLGEVVLEWGFWGQWPVARLELGLK